MAESPTEAAEKAPQVRSRSGQGLLSIGQLVEELRPAFPDLSISKVRYLENRGLITPERSQGKYRKYSRNDLRSLRSILIMQRDEYLPLDVIRRRIEATAAGTGEVLGAVLGRTQAPMTLTVEQPSYSMEDMCEALGVEEEFILGLLEFRLIERATTDSGLAFADSDLEAARICHRLARFQMEPRHLRAVSSAAERQAGLIEQVATPALRSGHADRKEYGQETVQELGALFAQLAQILLRRELCHIL
jgi:DNA-binding transcriptional MerR regulator